MLSGVFQAGPTFPCTVLLRPFLPLPRAAHRGHLKEKENQESPLNLIYSGPSPGLAFSRFHHHQKEILTTMVRTWELWERLRVQEQVKK